MVNYYDPSLSQDYIATLERLYGSGSSGAPSAPSAPTQTTAPTNTQAPASNSPQSAIQSGNVTIGGAVNSTAAATNPQGIVKFAVNGANGLEERFIYFPPSVYQAMLSSPLREKWGLDQQFSSGFPEIPVARTDEFRSDMQAYLTGNTLTSALQSMTSLDYGFDPTIVGPPPGFAWSTDPITGQRSIVDLQPLVGPKLQDFHFDAAQGQWFLVNDPSTMGEDLFEGVPLAVRPWLQRALDAGGDSSVVTDPAAKAWVDAILKQTTGSSRRQRKELPFGMGLAYKSGETPGMGVATPPVMPQTGAQGQITTPAGAAGAVAQTKPNYVGSQGSPRGGIPTNVPNAGAYNPNASNPLATRATNGQQGGVPQGGTTPNLQGLTLPTGEKPLAVIGNKAVYAGGLTWDISQGPPPAHMVLGMPGVGSTPGTVSDKNFAGADVRGDNSGAYNPVQGMPEDPGNYQAIADNANQMFTPDSSGQDFHFYVDEGGTLRAEPI